MGLDIITTFGFIVNGNNKVNTNVKLETHKIELMLSNDTRISPNSETIITAEIVGTGGFKACLVEQQH